MLTSSAYDSASHVLTDATGDGTNTFSYDENGNTALMDAAGSLTWPPPVSGTTYSLIDSLSSAMSGRRGVAEPGGHGWIASGAGGR